MADRGVGEALLAEANTGAVSNTEDGDDHRREEAGEVLHGGGRDPRFEGVTEAGRRDGAIGEARGAGPQDEDVVPPLQRIGKFLHKQRASSEISLDMEELQCHNIAATGNGKLPPMEESPAVVTGKRAVAVVFLEEEALVCWKKR